MYLIVHVRLKAKMRQKDEANSRNLEQISHFNRIMGVMVYN